MSWKIATMCHRERRGEHEASERAVSMLQAEDRLLPMPKILFVRNCEE